MILQDRQINDFYAPQVTLWKLENQASLNFADELKNLSEQKLIIAFDRYTWAELSSGQMPAQLIPSHCADFITVTDEQAPLLKSLKKFAQIVDQTPLSEASKKRLQKPLDDNCFEADFKNSSYLILDEQNELHPCTDPYEFEEQIKACFFAPSSQLIGELHIRIIDKEKIQIETGPKLRC
ncbi:hypothetical protein PQO01_11505 [Lentisphaera marina]|uniref:hypothetical protein n=1 Tax=Lentisphaera marina TaxID=1111041 RepID=UPI00236515DE|nr:hypothetical protein [Lentisphaera marina]MDD7985574.1 hypothetical protein [Lentisphaera marina]